MAKRRHTARPLPVVPEICDFGCPHAGFPPAETAGICRTMSAVWCRQLGELVGKNIACEWKKRRGSSPPGGRSPRTARNRSPES